MNPKRIVDSFIQSDQAKTKRCFKEVWDNAVPCEQDHLTLPPYSPFCSQGNNNGATLAK